MTFTGYRRFGTPIPRDRDVVAVERTLERLKQQTLEARRGKAPAAPLSADTKVFVSPEAGRLPGRIGDSVCVPVAELTPLEHLRSIDGGYR